MPLRIHKTFVIAPGFRINVNANGISASFGVPGSGVSFNEAVSYQTVLGFLAPGKQAATPADQIAPPQGALDLPQSAYPAPVAANDDDKIVPLWQALLGITALAGVVGFIGYTTVSWLLAMR